MKRKQLFSLEGRRYLTPAPLSDHKDLSLDSRLVPHSCKAFKLHCPFKCLFSS
nr:MAG TPA: hypothetical protein [Caudoviricetes sp.]